MVHRGVMSGVGVRSLRRRVPLFRIPTLGILVGFPMLRETVPKAVGRNERYDISFYNFVIR